MGRTGGRGRVLPPWVGVEPPLRSPSPVSPGRVAKLPPHAWPWMRVTMVTRECAVGCTEFQLVLPSKLSVMESDPCRVLSTALSAGMFLVS